MTSGQISRRVVVDRITWVESMLNEIQSLPLGDHQAFFADTRNVWTAESCLRRGLEALLDLGRHILAKGFGLGVSEYKEIAQRLQECGVLSDKEAELLRILAGYRNRLVHFYHEVSQEELYRICTSQLGDLDQVLGAFRRWLREHPDQIDEIL
jgi:uncharacterized protein YutE (UPF0331/DUF86 family)